MRALAAFFIAAMWAASAVEASDTVAFGNHVISVGDPVGKVIQAAGKPDNNVQLETAQGGGVGQRYEYYQRGKSILITIRDGRVVSIEELRD